MGSGELLNRLRRLAQRELDEILSTELLVRLPDGTARSAIEFTDDELFFMDLSSMKRSMVSKWRIRHKAAQKGFVYIGGGKLKHIASLTREDLQPLCALIEARADEVEAYHELDNFLVDALADLEKLGIDVDWHQDVADWLETGLG
ncbi:MAG: hypothetical protein WKF95_14085 [Rubrobacter sp.]